MAVKPPRITTAAVVLRGKKYLLVRRLLDANRGGCWEFPGGKAETDEDPKAALERELREELAVDASIGTAVFESRFRNEETEYRLLVFEAAIRGRPKAGGEHDRIGWFGVHELADLELSPSDRAIVAYLTRANPDREG